MRILFLSDYQALSKALEEGAEGYSDLDILSNAATTQPLALPDFDYLLIAPLGRGGEVGLSPDLEALNFWQAKLTQLVDLCNARDAGLLMVSSDLVFASKQQAVCELDTPENTSPLAHQLLHLESLAANCDQHVILRTPPLLSASQEGGLAHLIEHCKVHKAPENTDYRGLQTLEDLTRVLLGIALQLDSGAKATGIFHYAGSEPVSQTELMHTLARMLGTQPYPADHSGTNRQGMNTQHLLETFGVHPRAWRASLPALLEALNES